MITIVLNTKISEVENKVPDNSQYITTQEFNKLTAKNFAARLKQADLLNKTDFDNKLTCFNRRITSNKTKYFEVPKKLNSLIIKDYDFLFFNWKSNGVCNSKLKPLYTAFFNSIKLSEYRARLKFDKDLFAVEQNNYLTESVNVDNVCNLDAWPRNPINNFKFKNYLFGGTNIIKKSDKQKHVYSEYRITFDSAGSWSFGNDFPRNVVIFGADNSSSSHADNRKNKF